MSDTNVPKKNKKKSRISGPGVRSKHGRVEGPGVRSKHGRVELINRHVFAPSKPG